MVSSVLFSSWRHLRLVAHRADASVQVAECEMLVQRFQHRGGEVMVFKSHFPQLQDERFLSVGGVLQDLRLAREARYRIKGNPAVR